MSVLMFHLRRLIYRFTVFPPFRIGMRSMYRGSARLAAAVLRRDPAVISIYLRRGCAKGEDMPGISDVDLGAVIRGDVNAQLRLAKSYKRLRRFLPVLEDSIELYQEEQIAELHQNCQTMRFRFEEGKTGFVRLTGPPQFENLPPLDPAVWPDALRNESNIWWGIFSERFLNGSEGPFDPLLDAAHCVKTIAESLRTRCALETGTLPKDRRAALLWAREMPDIDQAIVARTLDMIDHRFRGVTPDFWEQTAHFLRDHSAWLHATLAARSPDTDRRQLPLSIEDDARERMDPMTVPGTITCRSMEFLVGQSAIVANLSLLPSLSRIREWVREVRAKVGPDVPLFFRHGDLFFQIGAKFIYFRARTVLHPLVNPEAFTATFPMESARWTEYQETTFVNWRRQRNWKVQQIQMTEASPVSLRREWIPKAFQLEALRRSALRGKVIYPLTLPAVVRAADREGISLPNDLRPLFSPDYKERIQVSDSVVDKAYANIEFLRL